MSKVLLFPYRTSVLQNSHSPSAGGSRNRDMMAGPSEKADRKSLVQSELLKRLAMPLVLVSVSVFSIFFARTSLFSSLYGPDSTACSLSKFPFLLATHTIDKNYMFLFCNGLLVFVAKYSGLIGCCAGSEGGNSGDDHRHSHAVDSYNESIESYGDRFPSGRVSREYDMEENEARDQLDAETVGQDIRYTTRHVGNKYYTVGEEEDTQEEEEEEEEEVKHQMITLDEAKEEEEDGASEVCDGDEHQKEMIRRDFQEVGGGDLSVEEIDDQEGEVIDIGEEEETMEMEEGNMVLNEEDLNKRFDDFIRRMKEELRIEAQGQLIMV